MSGFELARANLTAVPVLAFALGVLASRVKSDLRFPAANPGQAATWTAG